MYKTYLFSSFADNRLEVEPRHGLNEAKNGDDTGRLDKISSGFGDEENHVVQSQETQKHTKGEIGIVVFQMIFTPSPVANRGVSKLCYR